MKEPVNIYLYTNENRVWQATASNDIQKDDAEFLVKEGSYPAELYYVRFDLNGSRVMEREFCQNREKLKGQGRRNTVIKQNEQQLLETIETNAETLDEFLRLNDFDVTAQDIESGIEAGYEVETIFHIPDDYMDDDEFTSGLLDDR